MRKCIIKREVEECGVVEFTRKHRNPVLHDFHAVPRLRVHSQPPTVTSGCAVIIFVPVNCFYHKSHLGGSRKTIVVENHPKKQTG